MTASEPSSNHSTVASAPQDTETPAVTPRRSAFWATCGSTFITILLAEMGDKTQLATLLITAESQKPWVVFTGAATALVATSLIGVALGWWLAKRVSPKVMDLAAAMTLLTVSVLLLWDIVQL
ncbi:TMEM165/GDT1 family protein [Spirulina major]|uniref:TMEM165/GDT1 family protein n=1 Tax=Spirulina TaxID=1154 RepID=UPI0009333193|nr:TMEM165/GDT1 family protein [Spirulina major]